MPSEESTDILALLRHWDSPINPDNIREMAAQEIERLRSGLRMIVSMYGDDLSHERFRNVALHYAQRALAGGNT